MKRKSFLQPTSKTGVCGQNCRISGNHIALQLRSDIRLLSEKQSITTSDLHASKDIILKESKKLQEEKKFF